LLSRLSNTSGGDHDAIADEPAIHLLHAWLSKATDADGDATRGYDQPGTSNRKTSNRGKQKGQEQSLSHHDNTPAFFSAVTITHSKNSSAALIFPLAFSRVSF
jgi:hypothetical protein